VLGHIHPKELTINKVMNLCILFSFVYQCFKDGLSIGSFMCVPWVFHVYLSWSTISNQYGYNVLSLMVVLIIFHVSFYSHFVWLLQSSWVFLRIFSSCHHPFFPYLCCVLEHTDSEVKVQDVLQTDSRWSTACFISWSWGRSYSCSALGKYQWGWWMIGFKSNWLHSFWWK
jgi:hypothetical protein